jgi:putative spermidine/putrescine transport system permease protein
LKLFSIIVAVVVLAPLVILVLSSFTGAGYVGFPPQGFSLRWYEAAFENARFADGLRTSFVLALLVSPSASIIGIAAAFALVRYPIPGREAVSTFVMSPLLLPTVVTGMALLQFFAFIGFKLTFVSLVIGHTVLATPYVIRLAMAALEGTNPMLEAAAQSLGANPFDAFRLATIPIVLPSLIAGAAFAFIISFDDVSVALFLSRPGTTTLPAFVFNYATETSDPLVVAINSILIALAAVFAIVIQRTIGLGKLFGS